MKYTGTTARILASAVKINGDWTLVELPFDMENEDDLLTLYIEADHKHLDSAWTDELLVRRSDVDLYRTLPGQDKIGSGAAQWASDLASVTRPFGVGSSPEGFKDMIEVEPPPPMLPVEAMGDR
ncbi:MAG: hypothetical protein IPG74_14575 [Flavobacteriales bacterium]|nr:hypothetical protein [Flavobacteriales bacterium]